jgi:hypothetical protein
VSCSPIVSNSTLAAFYFSLRNVLSIPPNKI